MKERTWESIIFLANSGVIEQNILLHAIKSRKKKSFSRKESSGRFAVEFASYVGVDRLSLT